MKKVVTMILMVLATTMVGGAGPGTLQTSDKRVE